MFHTLRGRCGRECDLTGQRGRAKRLLFGALTAGLLSACAGDCFVAGTPVATPSGPVAIELLRAGDDVVCVDPATGVAAVGRVRGVRGTRAQEYLAVHTSAGRRVFVTRHHPFWDTGAGAFREIGDFAPGDRLLAWENGGTQPDRVERIEVVRTGVRVYHLEVEDVPNTFVASGLVVHNKPPVLPDPVAVTLVAEPAGAGWILTGNRFVGQGADTLLFLQEDSETTLEAVPRIGWVFDRWKGNFVGAADSFVVRLQAREGHRVTCTFEVGP